MSNKCEVNSSKNVAEHLCEGKDAQMKSACAQSESASSEAFEVSCLKKYSRDQLVGCIKGLIDAGKISGEDVAETSDNSDKESNDENKEEYFGERFTSSGAW